MKYILIEGDGMADYPVSDLGGKTPLMVANTPNMDEIAKKGASGFLQNVPKNFPPGSDVANLSILGYDPRKYFSGRGPLEAAAMGVKLSQDDVALRCNLITERDKKVADYSGGHISSKDGKDLVERLNKKLGKEGEIEFYPGVSYRNLLVLRGEKYSDQVTCFPPHDHIGTEFGKILVRAKSPEAEGTVELLNKLIMDSRDILSSSPVNKGKKNPANMIWFWGPGKAPDMPTFEEKYGLTGAVITAVDLLKGIGTYAGMKIIDVPGATGYFDTNYEGKAEYAVKALEEVDLVFVHVEAPDEAGHEGDLQNKIQAIENIDSRVIGKVLDEAEGEYTMAVFADHPTPLKVKTHVSDPVPFAVMGPNIEKDRVQVYDERSVRMGSFGTIQGTDFISRITKP